MFVGAIPWEGNYPFSLERITLQTPPGTPGWNDVTVRVPSGSATAASSFQYLVSAQSYSKPGFFRFLAYDQSRKRVYLTNIDHVEVFDLQLGAFIAPLEPPGGAPPNAGLRGLSLTPGGSQLLVADFGAQSVYVLNPDTDSGVTTVVAGIPGFASSGPSRVAATSAQTVFVGLSAEGGSGSGCATCLSQMDLSVSPPIVQTAPQPEVSRLLGAPLLQGNSAGDHVVLAFVDNSSVKLATWDASSPGQFLVSAANVAVQGYREHDGRKRVCCANRCYDGNSRFRHVCHGCADGRRIKPSPRTRCRAGRPSTANAHQRQRRYCFSGCCGDRQLASNFSRRASSKLTTTSTY